MSWTMITANPRNVITLDVGTEVDVDDEVPIDIDGF